MTRRLLPALLPILSIAAAGCAAGPNYVRPAAPVPAAFKAPEGWSVAAPADMLDRGDWWTLFGDPALDTLADELGRANQTLAQASANYAQARAATREARAALFPVVDLSGRVTRQGQGGSDRVVTDPVTGQIITVSGGQRTTRLQLGIGASWEPDLFGRIGRTVEIARANAAGAAADLASARLALTGELAANYLALRTADIEIALVEQTVAGFRRSLAIATNRYRAGVVARTDEYEARSQLASTLSQLEAVRRQRRQFENAIAVLVGRPAGDFTIAPDPAWRPRVPAIPATVPSTLLERRPDIASAERAAAAANAAIGVEAAAFFPTLALSADGGLNAGSLGRLFAQSATIWSLGAAVGQTLLDFGARSARVAQARAQYDATVAGYRQTVLVAFQEVEDQLTAAATLARQEALLREASAAADRTEAAFLNRYRAGLIPYTDVVTAQATALSARRALAQALADRQAAAVALIQALGGGWRAEGEAR